jgi:hypothetical protein
MEWQLSGGEERTPTQEDRFPIPTESEFIEQDLEEGNPGDETDDEGTTARKDEQTAPEAAPEKTKESGQ